MTLGPDEKSRRSADLVGVAAWAGGEFRRSGKLLVRRADGFTDRANGAVALDSLDEHEAAQLVAALDCGASPEQAKRVDAALRDTSRRALGGLSEAYRARLNDVLVAEGCRQ